MASKIKMFGIIEKKMYNCMVQSIILLYCTYSARTVYRNKI